ncbi:MAG TPA: ABC transporter permease [Actinomycetota bacterium]|nr:ABC transporter permease [Actinomycetota bacterium]
MSVIRPAFLIARKDLVRRIRDRTAILTAVLLPLGLAYIFSLTLANVDDAGFEATYAVADADGGHLAGALTQTLGAIGSVTVEPVPDAAAAERRTDDGDVDAAIVIPEGFTAGVEAGRGAELIVRTSADASIAGLVATSVVRSFAARLDAVSVAVAAASAADPGADAAALAERARQLEPSTEVVEATAEDRVFSSITFFAIGMAVFFLFFAVEFGVRGLLEEREDGTLARLLVAPIPQVAILAGKGLAALLVGLVSTTLLVVATTVLIDARWGNPIGVGLLVVAGVVAAVGVTALVSTFARTAAQAGAYASIVAVVGGLLGGTFFPIASAPGLLGSIRFLSPQGWLMEGFTGLASGEALRDVLVPAVATLAIGVICGAVAWRRARAVVAR